MMAIHHCVAQRSATMPDRDMPMRVMVGAMVMGPMKRIKNPTQPVRPMNISTSDAIVRQPWS